jgi:hypothetical protein
MRVAVAVLLLALARDAVAADDADFLGGGGPGTGGLGTLSVATEAPTQAPVATEAPTEAPTQAPVATEAPTQALTDAPTEAPTAAPTEAPTVAPTVAPSAAAPLTAAPTPAPVVVATAASAASFDLASCGLDSISDDTSLWKQGAIREAVFAAKPDVTVPLKGGGFNRTIDIDGITNDEVTLSTGLVCASQAGGIRARLKAPQNVSLHFTHSVDLPEAICPMTSISVYKTGQATAEMRFEFEGCTAGGQAAPVYSAAVLASVVADDTRPDFNLRLWAEEVCKPEAATTLPPAAPSADTLEFKVKKVGDGKCDATQRQSYGNSDVGDGVQLKEDDCRLQCVGSAQKQDLLGNPDGDQGCVGFAFKADTGNCITYNGNDDGKVDKATGGDDPGWTCQNISVGDSTYVKAPTPPPAPVQVVTQKLKMNQVFSKVSAAKLEEFHAPSDKPGCFPPMWFFRLEDAISAAPLSIAMTTVDFNALFIGANGMNPIITSGRRLATASVSAPQIIDRVLVNTDNAKRNGWSTELCPVDAETLDNDACRSEELVGAIIAGVVTSCLTWSLVAIWFCIFLRSSQSRTGYDQTAINESGQTGSRICAAPAFQFGMIIVTVGGAVGSCYLSMQFLDAVMNSSGCFNFDEFLVVMLAVMLSVSLAVIIFSLYMARHAGHPHPLLHNAATKVSRKDTKLMLVEVEDGSDVGVPLETISATKQDGRWIGFKPDYPYAQSPMNSSVNGSINNSSNFR